MSVGAREAANAAAMQRLLAVRPQWADVVTAGDVLALPPRTLLHAGPPFAHAARPSAPVLSSAILCCLYEGWASSEAEAEALIRGGHVRLRPAQDFDVVTPLAAVISPRTALVEIRDATGAGRCWSLLGSGIGPQLRFGSRDAAILPRLARRDEVLAPALRVALQGAPIDLFPLAREGLQNGDDLHAQTTAANAALCRELRSSLAESAADVLQVLEETPLFFLTLWMAACHLMLRAAADPTDPAATLVVALAGNGETCGIRLAGDPSRWISDVAPLPTGPRLRETAAHTSPAVGDSGVIDAAGFGAQAWARCPAIREAVAPGFVPASTDAFFGEHPAFAGLDLRIGLDAAAIDTHNAPAISLAMVDAAGGEGLLGRGLCPTSASLFQQALVPSLAINDPHAREALEAAFDAYERALTGNDVAELDRLFWTSPHVLRYGATENLYGHAEIQAFRAARPGKGLQRTVIERSVTTFGNDFAVANIVFTRAGESRPGRQTQSWVRLDGEWQVVAAHVSWMDQ